MRRSYRNMDFLRGTRSLGSWPALALIALLLAACGGGGGGVYHQPSPPPPSASLTYPSPPTFVVGTAITPITPTIAGTLSGFLSNPALPAGLVVDPNTGVLSGTPTNVTSTASYTISATDSAGATVSASIAITVNNKPPSKISYGATHVTFSATVAATTIAPTSAGGAVVGWSISPALPAGLNFSTTDGTISGTPSAASAAAPYVVTAQNSGGQSTVTVTIEVDAPPLINLGHQGAILFVRTTPTNVLSFDTNGDWILWGYSGATVVATGNSGCTAVGNCSPGIDLAGTTAVITTPTGLEMHATSDGHVSGSIATSVTWWKLATDGSYIAGGSKTGLSAWSPTGQLLFSRAGDYSQAVGFSAPGEILIGAGPAGQSAVETIAVPSGTSTTGPTFNGIFRSWFIDGGGFLTSAGTTILVYSVGGTQQGSIISVSAGSTVVGQGNWVWTYPNVGAALTVYPATGVSPAAAATYTFGSLATPYASGTTIGVLTDASATVSVIDLSGTAPVRTDHTAPIPMSPDTDAFSSAPYAAVSASQWIAGSSTGVLLDGPSLAGTVRYFGFGQAWSVAGGMGHFAIATASGTILYFNSATLTQEGQIAFPANKVALSADGTVLVAQGASLAYDIYPVEVYSLPAGNLVYTWPYTYSVSSGGTVAEDIELSGSGTVLGQILNTVSGGQTTSVQQASSPTGGATIFSNTYTGGTLEAPPLRLSPDGTLIAASQTVAPTQLGTANPGTNLYQNGQFVTATSGLTVGWLDNSRLVVNNYAEPADQPVKYSGCTLYGPTGSATGGACAIPYEVALFQPVTTDGIYVPATNQVLSVSTGAIGWESGDPDTDASPNFNIPVGAVAGSYVIFISGTNVLAQSY